YQVTNVVGGAYQPHVSPDGAFILFRNASGIGFDMHEMPFVPESWWPVTYDPERGYQRSAEASAASVLPLPDWGTPQPRTEEQPLPLLANEIDRPYFPVGLIPFNHNWVLLPAVYIVGDDPTFRLSTFV